MRPLSADDEPALREWLEAALRGTPLAGAEAALRTTPLPAAAEAALRPPSGAPQNPESLVLVADREGEPIGVAAFGVVSGSAAGRLAVVAVRPDARRQGVASALLAAVAADLAARGVALIVAELPDAPALGAGRAFLAARGFAREGLVRDYYRDGVSLEIHAFRPPAATT